MLIDPTICTNQQQAQAALRTGQRVKDLKSGREGLVVSVDSDGDPEVLYDGASKALPKYGKNFVVVSQA